ncbi:MAG: MOSC domain-containing protein [Spirulina sp. SIO3F2]|nr:MOSC domain-containing protein [Spirulina sp. SIO3F2]
MLQTAQFGQIDQINISDGGVPKRAIPEAEITENGLVGDRQKNRKYHGGPDRAVCLWSAEIIAALQVEGHPIEPGSAGENIAIAGLTWETLKPGMQMQLGEHVLLQITDYAPPCRTIARYFIGRRYGRISQKRNPGTSRLYAKVLSVGRVEVGDKVKVFNEDIASNALAI